MLTRIVKLTFEKDRIPNFMKIFEKHRNHILDFEGFISLELYQDSGDSQVFFTHSKWEDESSLENYRRSDYFRNVWSQTKLLFAAKPEAWSLKKVHPALSRHT